MMSSIFPRSSPSTLTTLSPCSVSAAMTSGPGPPVFSRSLSTMRAPCEEPTDDVVEGFMIDAPFKKMDFRLPWWNDFSLTSASIRNVHHCDLETGSFSMLDLCEGEPLLEEPAFLELPELLP